MIVEADESDGTFVRLPTEIGIVTNIDPEHLDYFKSVENMHANTTHSTATSPSMASPSPASITRSCVRWSSASICVAMAAAC